MDSHEPVPDVPMFVVTRGTSTPGRQKGLQEGSHLSLILGFIVCLENTVLEFIPCSAFLGSTDTRRIACFGHWVPHGKQEKGGIPKCYLDIGMVSEHYTATSQTALQVAVCTQGSRAAWTNPVSPSKTVSRGKVLRTSIRNTSGPKISVARHWSLPKATVWRRIQHWGLPGFHYINLLNDFLHQVASTAIHGATLQLQS